MVREIWNMRARRALRSNPSKYVMFYLGSNICMGLELLLGWWWSVAEPGSEPS